MTRSTITSLLLLAAFVAFPAAAQPIADASLLAEARATHAPAVATAEAAPALARHAQLVQSLPAPVYPGRVRPFGIEGQVQVAYTIDADGRTRDAEVIDGLGRDFDREALRVIRKARFTPAVDTTGKAVAVRYVTTFIFRPDN